MRLLLTLLLAAAGAWGAFNPNFVKPTANQLYPPISQVYDSAFGGDGNGLFFHFTGDTAGGKYVDRKGTSAGASVSAATLFAPVLAGNWGLAAQSDGAGLGMDFGRMAPMEGAGRLAIAFILKWADTTSNQCVFQQGDAAFGNGSVCCYFAGTGDNQALFVTVGGNSAIYSFTARFRLLDSLAITIGADHGDSSQIQIYNRFVPIVILYDSSVTNGVANKATMVIGNYSIGDYAGGGVVKPSEPGIGAINTNTGSLSIGSARTTGQFPVKSGVVIDEFAMWANWDTTAWFPYWMTGLTKNPGYNELCLRLALQMAKSYMFEITGQSNTRLMRNIYDSLQYQPGPYAMASRFTYCDEPGYVYGRMFSLAYDTVYPSSATTRKSQVPMLENLLAGEIGRPIYVNNTNSDGHGLNFVWAYGNTPEEWWPERFGNQDSVGSRFPDYRTRSLMPMTPVTASVFYESWEADQMADMFTDGYTYDSLYNGFVRWQNRVEERLGHPVWLMLDGATRVVMMFLVDTLTMTSLPKADSSRYKFGLVKYNYAKTHPRAFMASTLYDKTQYSETAGSDTMHDFMASHFDIQHENERAKSSFYTYQYLAGTRSDYHNIIQTHLTYANRTEHLIRLTVCPGHEPITLPPSPHGYTSHTGVGWHNQIRADSLWLTTDTLHVRFPQAVVPPRYCYSTIGGYTFAANRKVTGDTIDNWLIRDGLGLPPYNIIENSTPTITSFSPASGKRLRTITLACTDLPDSSAAVRGRLNGVYCTLTRWASDTVKMTVPSWTPFGAYWSIIGTVSGGDTTEVDTASDRFKVTQPDVNTRGFGFKKGF